MNLRLKAKAQITPRATVLNAALMWFSIGLTAMLTVAIIFGLIPQMQEVARQLFSNRSFTIMLSIGAIGLILGLSFMAKSASISTLIMMFIAFAIVEGFSLSMLLMHFAFKNQSWKILVVFLVPALTMLGMGFLGYKQIFDFSKIGRFLFISLIGLLVLGIIMFFIPNVPILWTVYSLLGYGIFTLYVGFDMWRISKFDKVLKMGAEVDKEVILRYGLIFGLSLLIDFIQLVWFLAQLLLGD